MVSIITFASQSGKRVSFQGVKRPGREVFSLLAPNSEGKNW